MRKLILLALLIMAIFNCNGNSLKEKNSAEKEQIETVNEKRELRYLFYANGGLLGYFDDGTVAGCPRCSLVKENIEALYSEKPFKIYIVEKDGSLLINGNEREFPKEINEDGFSEWAMIDYKWVVDL